MKMVFQQISVTNNNKTYLGLYVKCPKCTPLTKSGVCQQIFIQFPIQNFTEMHPVGATRIHVDRHDEANKPFLQLYKCA